MKITKRTHFTSLSYTFLFVAIFSRQNILRKRNIGVSLRKTTEKPVIQDTEIKYLWFFKYSSSLPQRTKSEQFESIFTFLEVIKFSHNNIMQSHYKAESIQNLFEPVNFVGKTARASLQPEFILQNSAWMSYIHEISSSTK